MPIRRFKHTSSEWFLLAFILLLVGGTFAQDAAPAKQRPFEVNDLFELESVGMYFGGPYSFSPDGKQLAFTRVRAKKYLANYKWEYLWGNAGSDVWLQTSPSESPVNLTDGIKDGSGWWSPQWSPDGERIAMLSTRGGNAMLWVWDRRNRQMRQLTKRGVDLNSDVHERPFVWIDNDHILCPVLPEGEMPLGMKIELQTPTIATAEWPKTAKGKEAAVSVLQSGISESLSDRPQSELWLIDVGKGTSKSILKGNARSLQISPTHDAVAFTQQVSIFHPKASETLGFDSTISGGLSTIGLAQLDGTPVTLSGDISKDVLPDSLRWSADGRELVFFGYSGERNQAPLLYRLNVASHSVASTPLEHLDASAVIRQSTQLEWTSGGELIVLAAKMDGDKRPDVVARRDWYLVTKDGKTQCLTTSMKSTPREIWPQKGGMAFVGVADAKIWRIEPASGKVEDLTADFHDKVAGIVWPSMSNFGTDQFRTPGDTYSQLVFTVQNGELVDPYLLDIGSHQITKLAKPAPKADLVAYSPSTSTAIYYATDRNGLHVWRNDLAAKTSSALVSANEFLRNVAESDFKRIDYVSLNGQKLKGWIMLPYGYEAGKKYPLLVWVYDGWVAKDRPPTYDSINSSLSLNLQIPAAKGYAVLFPSMPLAEEGLTEDPMLRLPEGVLPAVDKSIELGIADPDRLFLMGQSFGGFSTYGLVTQTQRFNAAVSLAGLSDLISLYGQLGARERYAEHPQEDLFVEALMESAQVGMGNPPWKDFGRYVRNSPIFYVDRVKTPIMIIQGDMDYVAIQQGEEFFTSLYRQGKRAEFVRYWGEGHVLESPANIRDMWTKIFSWFDEFSKPKKEGEEKGH
ncbi:MAG TPA: prolyl oligopeptidase family serine peptidase [Candidatus Koribacter sp.]